MSATMPGITVRAAFDSDLNAIAAIERTCFSTPWSRRSIRHELTASTHAYNLCATDADGRVTGYLIGWKIHPEFHLGNLAVHPAHRNRGVATALCERLFRGLDDENYDMATLEVREHNTAARALYARFGFRPVALRRGYYADTGENAVIMIKNLDAAYVPGNIMSA